MCYQTALNHLWCPVFFSLSSLRKVSRKLKIPNTVGCYWCFYLFLIALNCYILYAVNKERETHSGVSLWCHKREGNTLWCSIMMSTRRGESTLVFHYDVNKEWGMHSGVPLCQQRVGNALWCSIMMSTKSGECTLVFHYDVNKERGTHSGVPLCCQKRERNAFWCSIMLSQTEMIQMTDTDRDDPDDTDTETQTDRLSLTVGSFVWSRL